MREVPRFTSGERKRNKMSWCTPVASVRSCAGGWGREGQVLDQPGLHSKIPSQKEKSHKQNGLFLSHRLPSSLLEPKVRGEGMSFATWSPRAFSGLCPCMRTVGFNGMGLRRGPIFTPVPVWTSFSLSPLASQRHPDGSEAVEIKPRPPDP